MAKSYGERIAGLIDKQTAWRLLAWVGRLLRQVLYYILIPLRALGRSLAVLLLGVLAPFWYLGFFLFRVLTWPMTLLARLETLYIYFGVAVIVGGVTGWLLYRVASALFGGLGLHEDSRPEDLCIPIQEMQMESLPSSDSLISDRAKLRRQASVARREVGPES